MLGRRCIRPRIFAGSEKTQVPLYGAWDFLLGSGLVGGKMISGFAHGQAAAGMGMRILDGTRPADIPVVTTPDQPAMFDYEVLTTLGINRDLLPEDSVLINEPSPFYSINRHQFWTIIISLVVLFMVLMLLVINIWERKQIEVRTFESAVLPAHPHGYFARSHLFHGSGREITGVNHAFERWFGVMWPTEDEPGPLPNSTVSRFVPLLDTRMDSFEAQIRHGDGSMRSVVLHKATYAEVQGANAGIVGVIYDISDRKKAEDDLRCRGKIPQYF